MFVGDDEDFARGTTCGWHHDRGHPMMINARGFHPMVPYYMF